MGLNEHGLSVSGQFDAQSCPVPFAQHESTAAEPLDELYDTLADLLNEEESTRCYKNYLLVKTITALL